MDVLGFDIGGSGVKAAIVDTRRGVLKSDRLRLPTPRPATPASVLEALRALRRAHRWDGPEGVGFPGVIRGGHVLTAVNLHPDWVGINLASRLAGRGGRGVAVVNDADAAGLAEMRFGHGKGVSGTVMMLTIGTGIGTAMFVDGVLVPNTEIGHMEFRGDDAEKQLSEPSRKKQGLSWAKWGKRFNAYLGELEKLFWPELFILGGGGAKVADKFQKFLKPRTPVVFAKLGNHAGMIGAAIHAAESLSPPRSPARGRTSPRR